MKCQACLAYLRRKEIPETQKNTFMAITNLKYFYGT